MKWLRLKLWLFRYSLQFRSRTGWSFLKSWEYGESTADIFLYDLDDMGCPIEMVGEDLFSWSD